jgi:hypothetical protein
MATGASYIIDMITVTPLPPVPSSDDRLSFGQTKIRRWLSSGLQRRVVWYKFTYVSEALANSVIWAIRSDDGGSKYL